MYKIGEISRLCRLSVKTLRYYESEGLLTPNSIDRFTGYRYYSAAKLADCNRIIALKELGFSLEEIRKHLNADSADDVIALIDAKQNELRLSLEQTNEKIRRLESARKSITEGENNMFDVVIRQSDTVRIAFCRKLYETKEAAFEEIERIKSILPKHSVGKRTLIINYETEHKDRFLDLAACVEINGSLPKDFRFSERTIAMTGEIATLICQKENLEEAYSTLYRQINNKPAQIVGAAYEYYHGDGTVELKLPICSLLSETVEIEDDELFDTFENDTEAVGAWEFVDMVPSKEQYSKDSKKYGDRDNIWLKKLYFLPNGENYWIVSGWTKGYLYTHFNYPDHTYKHKYTIETNDGETLMFIEMKNRYHEMRGGKPLIYVYRKIDGKGYNKHEIRIYDNVDYPFVNDNYIIGKWVSCDFSRNPEKWAPGNREYKMFGDDLFFKSIEFMPNGNASAVYGENAITAEWTKGILLHKTRKIAENYYIKTIQGKDYLIMEWKSGDYAFGGRIAGHYILERE